MPWSGVFVQACAFRRLPFERLGDLNQYAANSHKVEFSVQEIKGEYVLLAWIGLLFSRP